MDPAIAGEISEALNEYVAPDAVYGTRMPLRANHSGTAVSGLRTGASINPQTSIFYNPELKAAR